MGPLSTKHNSDDLSDVDTSLKNVSSSCENDKLSVRNIKNGGTHQIINESKEVRIFYAVHIPLDSQLPSSSDVNDCSSSVFEDKQEALKLVKKFKRARFKAFNSINEAIQFTINGITNTSTAASHSLVNSPIDGTLLPISIDPLPVSVGEKPSPFKGPKSQDLVRLRKAIESGDINFIQKAVWENPRYLVSNGDTPSILHEGSRYNALHVCAKFNRPGICSLILQTVSDVDFIRRLYGDSSETIEAAEDRCNVLLDLYLNMPDKGFNETPLHLAVKHGALDVVQILVSYSQCDRNMLNKFGQQPKEIICSRVSSGSGDSNKDLHKRISLLLEEQYFVPVLRSKDPSIQPTIGQPFSPSSPLKLSGDIVSPRMEVQGVAGPMPLEDARVFRKKWKTPPRDPHSLISPLMKTMLGDHDKGLEKVGRELAQDNNISWIEYWPFLDRFANFRTEEGLILLEQYLLKRFRQGPTDSANIKGSNKSIQSDIIRKPNSTGGSQAITTPTKSPISDLCDALRSCRISIVSSGSDSNKSVSPFHPIPTPSTVNYNNEHERYNGLVQSEDAAVVMSPHLYIEKSCQVFARRIADGIQRFPEAPGEAIAAEAIYLNMLVASFLTDSRFAVVNFSRLHCRLANCIIQKFDWDEKESLKKAADAVLDQRLKTEDSSSEEEMTPFRDYQRKKISRKQKLSINSGVRCIAQHMTKSLVLDKTMSSDMINSPSTEEECVGLWESAAICDCTWSPQQSRTRHSLRRTNYSATLRRIDFSSPSKGENKEDESSTVTDKLNNCCEESAGEESDTSDTDGGEFFTPPSSPRDKLTPLTSEDDFEMDSPDEGPDVYVEGDFPTSLDNAVLDAIGEKELDPNIYPNICRWKHLVMLHSASLRERWPSPRKFNIRSQNDTRSSPASTSPLLCRSKVLF